MHHCRGLMPLFVVLTLTSFCQGVSNPFPPGDVTCKNSTVQLGSTGHLVVNLGENPYLYNDFHLYIRHEGKTVYTEDCFLEKGRTEKKCNKKIPDSSGIQTRGVQSDTLTLLFHNATFQFSGQFEVRLHVDGRSRQGTCTVIVSYPENNSIPSRHADEGIVTTPAPTSTPTKVGIVVSVIVSVLVSAIVVLVCIWYRKHRRGDAGQGANEEIMAL